MSDRRHDVAALRVFIAQGTPVDRILEATGWTAETLGSLQAELFAEEERLRVGRRPEDVFVEYSLRTEDNVAALDDLIEQFHDSRQGSALVGAIKAKQDLYNQVIKLGQELGLVKKEPNKHVHLVGNMSDPELRVYINRKLRRIRELSDRGNDLHLLDVPTEGDEDTPGAQVIEVPAAPAPPPKRSKTSAAVRGGIRAIRKRLQGGRK